MRSRCFHEARRKEEINKLAGKFNLDPIELSSAEKEIPVLDERIIKFMGKWMLKVAKTFEYISVERERLIGKLKNIAEISNI